MDSDIIIGLIVLVLGLIAFLMLVAAEAGVIAGVRERALREPAESRVQALRRFYEERQVTLSSLNLARNLALVAVTAIAVFMVFREIGDNWAALSVTVVVTATAFVLLQAFPRILVARNPERWQRLLRPFTGVIRALFRAPVRLLDAPMGAVERTWQRLQPAAGIGAEELLLITEMEEPAAELEEDERQMIRGVMELETTTVREVMVPRTDIVAMEVSEGFEKLSDLMVEKGYSRIPVYESNMDNIIGIAFGKDVMKRLANGPERRDVRDLIRTAHFVPESKKVDELLAEMKQKQLSVAVVVDEYGGTAGLLTIEDLLEEIVGEIRDEFDIQEQTVELVSANDIIVDGRVGIDDLNDLLDTEIQKQDFDSVGGLIINELGRMPSVGDMVQVNGITLKVLTVIGRRIKKVRVTKVREGQQQEGVQTPS